MDIKELTTQDWQMILESLKYTKLRWEEYQDYPTYEFKQQRVEEVNQLILKIEKLSL